MPDRADPNQPAAVRPVPGGAGMDTLKLEVLIGNTRNDLHCATGHLHDARRLFTDAGDTDTAASLSRAGDQLAELRRDLERFMP